MKSLQRLFDVVITVLFTLLAISSYHHFVTTGTAGSLGLLAVNALIATDPGGPHPNVIEQFLGTHPAARACTALKSCSPIR